MAVLYKGTAFLFFIAHLALFLEVLDTLNVMQRIGLGVFLFICLFPQVFADTIHLKSGRTISGVVISETEESVQIEMAMGVVTYPKDNIVRIDRNTRGDERRNELKQETVFAEELEDMRSAVADIYSFNGQLMTLKGRQTSIDKKTETRNRSIQRKREQKTELEEKLEPFKNYRGQLSGEIVDAYNELYEQHLEVEETLEQLQEQQDDSDSERAKIATQIGEMNRTLRRKLDALKSRMVELQKEGCPASLMERAQKALDDLSDIGGEHNGPIALERRGNSYFLYVTLNKSVTTEFILDTGCSTTLISRRIFDQLDPTQVEYEGQSQASIADGSVVNVDVYRVDLAEIGGFQVRYMTVMVPRARNRDVPLLLGMSFLKHFRFSIDTEKHQLVLDRN
jgi:predicted aspartyl protease/RNase P/RNase MRP subunit p29